MKSILKYLNSLFAKGNDPLLKAAARQVKPSARRIISLEEYNTEVAKCILPSEADTERFIFSRLAGAHSWHNHLTDMEETPFYFYLDPNPGISITNIHQGNLTIPKNLNRPGVSRKLRWNFFVISDLRNGIIKKIHGEHFNLKYINGPFWMCENEEIIILSDEVLEQGKFMLSRYIHTGFGWRGSTERHIEYRNYHIDLARRLKVFLMGLLGVEIDKDKPLVTDNGIRII